jgi:hypothetical protein
MPHGKQNAEHRRHNGMPCRWRRAVRVTALACGILDVMAQCVCKPTFPHSPA